MMKNLLKPLLGMLCLVILASENSYGQINVPSLSPRGKIIQTVGTTEFIIDYGRPSIRGRQIFGEGSDYLLPFGTVWRTGAGAVTTISFDDDIKINGVEVPEGTYSIFSIPGPEEWTIMLYKDLSVNGNNPANYKKEDEQARFTVKAEKMDWKMETLTFGIGDITPTGKAGLDLLWENFYVRIDIDTESDAEVMEQIASVMENPEQQLVGLYTQSANYYLNNGKDMKKALEWISKAIELNPSMFNYNTKALIQVQLKDYKGAIASNQKAHELGKKSTGGTLNFYNSTFKAQLDNQIAEWKAMK